MWRAMLAVCGVFYAAVLAGLLVAIVRQRRDAPDAAAIERADRRLRRGLVAWVVAVAASLTGLAAASYTVDRRLATDAGGDLSIRVTAKQWWWQVEYLHADPSLDFVTANEIVLPVGREASVALEAGDVIHSLWIPNVAGKRDMIPGRRNHMTLTPRVIGDFRGQCAEFCGLQHAFMALDVHVLSGTDFEQWQAAQRTPAPPPRTELGRQGMQVFMNEPCVMCHTIAGTDAGSRYGPDLTHLSSRSSLAAGRLTMSRASLRDWIRDPQAHKPGNNMPRVDLSSTELDALTAYLWELK
jgi:cytochrome c oxidase subunit 2